MPDSARSAPVLTVSGCPELTRYTPATRHPDASARAMAPVNCGDSTVAVRLTMCRRQLLQYPLSVSKLFFASASDGGLMSDTGSMYPVATFSGPSPWLIRPMHFDTV